MASTFPWYANTHSTGNNKEESKKENFHISRLGFLKNHSLETLIHFLVWKILSPFTEYVNDCSTVKIGAVIIRNITKEHMHGQILLLLLEFRDKVGLFMKPKRSIPWPKINQKNYEDLTEDTVN